jgi:hypothetical protein
MDFVLTFDIEWASEYCIEHVLQIADRFLIKPTFFVTHSSPAVRKAFADERVELGIHPNFLPGSSHGDDTDSVIETVLRLAPQATAVRCHRYIYSEEIGNALTRHGLKIDSNICHHLTGELRPIALDSGLLRLPVFFEDDIHWTRGLAWHFDEHAADFFSPGLKILNFHPFFVALNAVDAQFYAQHKKYIRTLSRKEAAALRFSGAGTETFLIDSLEQILARGHRFLPLGELAARLGAVHNE